MEKMRELQSLHLMARLESILVPCMALLMYPKRSAFTRLPFSLSRIRPRMTWHERSIMSLFDITIQIVKGTAACIECKLGHSKQKLQPSKLVADLQFVHILDYR